MNELKKEEDEVDMVDITKTGKVDELNI